MSEHRARVFGKQGLEGTLLDPVPPLGATHPVRIELDNGRIIEVPPSALRGHSPGKFSLDLGPNDVLADAKEIKQSDGAVIPVLEEELHVDRQPVVTGAVRVHRRVLEHEEDVDIPLLKEHVDVKRIPMDREVDGPLPVRTEGDTTIIPIVEEVVVISKKFVLKEEVHLIRTTREERHQERVILHRQESDIERVGRLP